MDIEIKNKHLYFTLGAIWEELNYKFRYVINQKVVENDDDEYIQTISIDKDILQQIINYVNILPQGMAREINPEMFTSIIPQIMALAAQGDGEAIDMMGVINEAVEYNIIAKNQIIERGKQNIKR